MLQKHKLPVGALTARQAHHSVFESAVFLISLLKGQLILEMLHLKTTYTFSIKNTLAKNVHTNIPQMIYCSFSSLMFLTAQTVVNLQINYEPFVLLTKETVY